MKQPAIVLSVCVVFVASAAGAQTPSAMMPINPDRPDLTNSPRLVAPGIVQVEAGVIHTRFAPGLDGFGSPVLARIGVRDWIEAQVGTDGLLTQSDAGARATGIGNVRLGAKIRLVADSAGLGLLSMLPQVTLPSASADKHLGSGDPDYTLTLMTGRDIGSRAHIDTNYTVGAIGGGGGRRRFVQQVLSASVGFTLTAQLSPYFEGFGISRQEAGGGAITAINTGAIYTIGTRMAVDGGVQAGISRDAPTLAVFGGFSVALGQAREGRPRAQSRAGPHQPQ